MKYILYPIGMILSLSYILFFVAPIKFLWHLIWHFEIISFQHAASLKDALGKRYYFLSIQVLEDL